MSDKKPSAFDQQRLDNLRIEALRCANVFLGREKKPEEISARAEVFFKFLKG